MKSMDIKYLIFSDMARCEGGVSFVRISRKELQSKIYFLVQVL